MFSNLRTNSQIYILHKDSSPYVETGQVVSVSSPVPKISNTFMAPQEMVVDIVVNVGGNNITLQKLPANFDTADQGTTNGALFISTTREAMNTEIALLKQKSQSIVDSVGHHKKVIQDCEILLQRLNPEFAEQKQQKQDIINLKSQMSDMMASMKELMAHLKKETEST